MKFDLIVVIVTISALFLFSSFANSKSLVRTWELDFSYISTEGSLNEEVQGLTGISVYYCIEKQLNSTFSWLNAFGIKEELDADLRDKSSEETKTWLDMRTGLSIYSTIVLRYRFKPLLGNEKRTMAFGVGPIYFLHLNHYVDKDYFYITERYVLEGSMGIIFTFTGFDYNFVKGGVKYILYWEKSDKPINQLYLTIGYCIPTKEQRKKLMDLEISEFD